MTRINIMLIFLIFFTLTGNSYAQTNSIAILPTDDAFLVSNLMDVNNEQGIGDLNSGDLEFLKVWYSWNTTELNEMFFAPAYLKFDLSEIKQEDIISAKLKMLPYKIKSQGTELTIFLVLNNNWNEKNITFNNGPSYGEQSFSSVPPTSVEEWHIWDLTQVVKLHAGSQISLAVAISTLKVNSEEMLVFYSKESQNIMNYPHLEIELAGNVPLGSTTFKDSSDSLILPLVLTSVAIGAGGFVAGLVYQKNKAQNSNR